jgi:hypothetical protein
MKKRIFVAILLLGVLMFAPMADVSAKGGGGGGRGGGGGGSRGSSSSSRGSSSKSTSPKSSTSSKSTPSTPSKPTPPKSNSRSTPSKTTKPGTDIKTSDGKTVKTSPKAPSNKKYNNQAGVTGADGYSPRFNNGYSAPAGSVVYYPQHSFIDYLPWIYLFSQNSPANDSATVVQPDGKEVVAKPEPEGTDGLAVFNWFMLILIGLGAVGLVIYLVNRFTSK